MNRVNITNQNSFFFVISSCQCAILNETLTAKNIREVKHDVYGKRQTAKIELLVSDFSRLYNLGKLFAFTVIKGFFSFFSTGFI